MVSLKYKLRPSRAQHARLAELLDQERKLYNAALEERISAWRRGISITQNDQTKSLTEIRRFDPTYGEVPYNLSKWTLCRLDDAMKGFFRRAKSRAGKAGFPRFRPASRWYSFGFSQIGGLRVKDGALLFKGLTGRLRFRQHRPLPTGAILKSAVFTRTGRAWHVCLTASVPAATHHTNVGSTVGIDVGTEALATLDDGTRVENIRPGGRQKQAIRRAARALSRCKRGSHRRAKVRARLARAQRDIRNSRSTYLHQLSRKIADRYALIAVEKLQLRNMTRSAKGTDEAPGSNVRQKAGLNRALADAAPGRLISMLRYKAEWAGGVLVEVDPKRTSQECSSCGQLVPKALKERRHICACSADLHRDHNAAINILKRGLAAHEAARRLGELNVADCGVRAPGTADLLAA